MATERKDVWASGDAYEPYVGRWSRLIARQFLAWLGVPLDKTWLDVGCGTGGLSQVILDTASPRNVLGVDPSDGFVSFARHKVSDPRAIFQVGDAQKLPLANSSFDAAVAGLVIFVSAAKTHIFLANSFPILKPGPLSANGLRNGGHTILLLRSIYWVPS